MVKRERSEFTCKVEFDSLTGCLFRFLGGQRKLPPDLRRRRKEKAIDAMLAFWLPYALTEEKSDPSEVRKAAEQSIRSLQRQIEIMRLEFNLEVTQESGRELSGSMTSAANLSMTSAANSPATVVSQASAVAEMERPPGIYPQGVDVNLDELLGDLL